MLQPDRIQFALKALRTSVQNSALNDPELRAALAGTTVEELLSEVASALESESFPKHAALALRVFEEIGLPKDQPQLMGAIIQGIGKAHERLGNSSEAYDAYQRALNLAESAKDESLAAGCLRRMGRVMTRMAQWQTATELLDKSENIYKTLDDRLGHAETLCDIGSLNYQKGNLPEAEAAYRDALKAAEEVDDITLVINLENNLGVLANIRGDLDSAIEHYKTSASMAEKIRNESLLAQAHHNLGMAYADRGDWPNAGTSYEKALELAHRNGIANVIGTVHLNRGEMYLELGDTTSASVACGRALSMFRTTRDRLGEAEVYRVLGDVFVRRGNEVTAMKMFDQCLEMTKLANAPLETAETYRAMGRAHERLGHPSQAIEAYQEASSLFRKIKAQGDADAVEKALERLRKGA